MTGRERASDDGCLFCTLASSPPDRDRERLVLYRGKLVFLVINRYPYTSGHLMVAPYAHVADLEGAAPAQLAELMALARAAEGILRTTYAPDGFNVGINIGEAAGAGVPGHLHLHLVPRWRGDTNFLGATAETRIVPETPEQTWDRLRPAFEGSMAP